MDPGHARGIPLHPGALFDADYEDYPFQTCMRDGEIANLDATRDLTDADVVHVTWEVTDLDHLGAGCQRLPKFAGGHPLPRSSVFLGLPHRS